MVAVISDSEDVDVVELISLLLEHDGTMRDTKAVKKIDFFIVRVF